MLQQGVDHQGIGLGRAELLGVVAPEGQVAGRRRPPRARPAARRPRGRPIRGSRGRKCPRSSRPRCVANLSHQTARASSRSDMASWRATFARRGRLLFDLHVERRISRRSWRAARRRGGRRRCFPGRGRGCTGRRSPECSRDRPAPRTRWPRCSSSSTSSSKAAAAPVAPLDPPLRGGQAAVHVALHAGRGHRHDADLPGRRLV